MAIDARIPLGVAVQPMNSPLETMGKAMSLRSLVSQGQMQDLALEEGRQKRDAQLRSIAGQQSLSELLAKNQGGDGRVDHFAVERGLAERGYGALALSYGDKRRADAKSETEQTKAKLETYKARMQLMGSSAGGILALPEPVRPQAYAAARAQMIQQGIADEASIPSEYDGNFLTQTRLGAIDSEKQVDQANRDLDYQLKVEEAHAKMNAERPKTLMEWNRIGSMLLRDADAGDAEQIAEARRMFAAHNPPKEVLAMFETLTPKQAEARGLTPEERQRAADAVEQRRVSERGQNLQEATTRAGQGVTVRGQNMTDARARELNEIAQNKPPTASESKAASFYGRMKSAIGRIEQGDERMTGKSAAGAYAYKYLPNIMQGKDNQVYRQAQRTFTEARLRAESGAAVPAGEYENDEITYFPQPGDKPETLKQKATARREVMNGLRVEAGRAAELLDPVGAKSTGGNKKFDPLGVR